MVRTARRLLVASALLLPLSACALEPTARTPEDSAPRVLVIGIDGVRPDALQAAHTPHLDRLIAEGLVSWDAYAGGGAKEGDPTRQATSSGPCWSSILTGVWRDKHGVEDNSFEGNNLEAHPHIFVRIRKLRPDSQLVSIVNWDPINEHLLRPFPGAASLLVETETDAEVASAAALHLAAADPDVLFLHLDEVDGAGHEHGYGRGVRGYCALIERTDEHVGTVLAALESRPAYLAEDWLVLVTTDHGGIGTSHGGHTPEERTIWIIARGRRIPVGSVSPGPGHTVIARTVLDHLGIEVPGAWGLVDSRPYGAAVR